MKRPLLLALVALAAALAVAVAMLTGTDGPRALDGPQAVVEAEPERSPGSFEPDPAERAAPRGPEAAPESSPPERAALAAPEPEASEPPETPTSPNAASLAGRVVYANGIAATDAQLELVTWYDETGVRPRIPPGEDGERRPILLEPSATFHVDPVEPGAHRLHAWSARGVVRLDVELEEGERRADLLLELTPAGAVHGLVQDRDGSPLPGRPVALMTGFDPIFGVPDGESGADGRFALASVPAGSYTIVAGPPSGTSLGADVLEHMWSAEIQVDEGRVTEVVLGPPRRQPTRLYGKVLRGSEPVADANLFLLREGETLLGSARAAESGEDGSWSMSVAEPGLYTLVAAASGERDFPTLAVPLSIPDVEALEHDVLLPGGGVEGVVRASDGEPLSASLFAAREDRFLEMLLPDEEEHTRTDERGRFTLGELTPGAYLLHVKPRNGRHARAVRRVVIGDELEQVDVVLEPSAKIVGRVLGPDGRPFDGAIVHALGPDGRPLAVIGLTGSRSDGSFECDRLPRGPLTLFARSDELVSPESAPIRTVPGETAEVELRLAQGTVLHVRTLDADGQALPAGVRVLDERGRDVGAGTAPAGLQAFLRSGFSSTTRQLGPFLPGPYRVEAVAAGGRRAARNVEIGHAGRLEMTLELE